MRDDWISTITCCCGFNSSIKKNLNCCPKCGANLKALKVLREIPERLFDDAKLLFADGKTREAEARLIEALVLEPGFTKARVRLTNSYIETKEWERAKREVQVGLNLTPENSHLRRLSGVITTHGPQDEKSIASKNGENTPGEVKNQADGSMFNKSIPPNKLKKIIQTLSHGKDRGKETASILIPESKPAE